MGQPAERGFGRADTTGGDLRDTPAGGATAPTPSDVPGGATTTRGPTSTTTGRDSRGATGTDADPNADIAGGRTLRDSAGDEPFHTADDEDGKTRGDAPTPDQVPERTDWANDITGGASYPGEPVATEESTTRHGH